METNKTKLPFLFLTILAIASFAQMVEADGLDCSDLTPSCSSSCWKPGNCQSCCRKHGYPEGKCSLKHGDGCYCCSTTTSTSVDPAGFLP